MNVTPHFFHTAQPRAEPQSADTIGCHIGEKGPDHVNNEIEEDFEIEHGGMMALSGQSVKEGKPGCDPGLICQFFPSLQLPFNLLC